MNLLMKGLTMLSAIQNIIARGRAFGLLNSEQYVLIWQPVFHRPLSGSNGKYFNGNVSRPRKVRRANGKHK
jgi:hypothetical protein